MMNGAAPPINLPGALSMAEAARSPSRRGLRKHLIAGLAGAGVVFLFLLVVGAVSGTSGIAGLVPISAGTTTTTQDGATHEAAANSASGLTLPVAAVLFAVASCLFLGRRHARGKLGTLAGPRELAAVWMAKGMSGVTSPMTSNSPRVQPELATPPPQPMPRPIESYDGAPDGDELTALLRWGQQAARSGERLVAQWLFLQALDVDPTSEDVWLWVAGTTDQPHEAIRCLRRVLQLNPNNARAIQGLNELQERTIQFEAQSTAPDAFQIEKRR